MSHALRRRRRAGQNRGVPGDLRIAILGLLEVGVLHWVERSRDDLTARQAARLLAAILWTGLRDLSGA